MKVPTMVGVPAGPSATEWAHAHGHSFIFWSVPTNRKPGRGATYAGGVFYLYEDRNGRNAIVMPNPKTFPDCTEALYVVRWPDATCETFYVTGWSADTSEMMLGTLNGAPAGWDLQPRKVYFLHNVKQS